MIDATFKFEGAEAILKLISDIPELANLGMEDAAKTLRSLAVGGTPYSTGAMKGSWSSVQQTSSGFTFGNPKDYSVTLEEGLYTRVGPRTVATGKGIFSRQAPEGVLTPIVADETVLNRVLSLIADQLEKGAPRAAT